MECTGPLPARPVRGMIGPMGRRPTRLSNTLRHWRSEAARLFRLISWIVLALGFLHMSHVELGFPPDRNPLKPKPPVWHQRYQYLGMILLSLPGAAWGVVRACRDVQRTPWE